MEDERTDIAMIVEMHGNVLYRICFILLKSEQDVQKVLLDIFRYYIAKAPVFQREAQRKAWLIGNAFLLCRKVHRQQGNIDYEMIRNDGTQAERKMKLAIFLNLHRKYKIVLLLKYTEGYESKEISKMLRTTIHAVERNLKKSERILEEIEGISGDNRKAGMEELLADIKISEKWKDSIIWNCKYKDSRMEALTKGHVWFTKKYQAPEYR